jgi:hypothetical protein
MEDIEMKNWLLCVWVMVAVSVASANTVYVETVPVYTYSTGTINWTHTYDHSVNPVTGVFLTIIADDVDGPGDGLNGEQDEVWVKDPSNVWHNLGLLNDMGYYTNWGYWPGPGNLLHPDAITGTVFSLDPSWLNGIPIEVRIEPSWGAEIELSTLTVIPEPATIGLLGLGALGLLRKRRA